MRARLLSRSGKLKGQDFEVTGKLTIGRSSESSVVLPSRMISGQHAEIVFDGAKERYYLEDLGSLNGTELDGIPVHGRERLDRLHVITFAGAFEFIWQGVELCAGLPPLSEKQDRAKEKAVESTIHTSVEDLGPSLRDLGGPLKQEPATEKTQADVDAFELPSALAEPPAEKPQAAEGGTRVDLEAVLLPPGLGADPEPPPAVSKEPAPKEPAPKPPAPEPPRPSSGAAPAEAPPEASEPEGFVLVITREDRIHRVQLREGENLVGRRLGAEVYIDSSEISRRHAVLTVSGSTVRLRDEGSRNHTYLNGQQVTDEVEVPPGAQVRFGVIETLLVLRD